MSGRGDIIDGSQATDNRMYGLIYTKKCGWIDLGHANPKGASGLFSDVRANRNNIAASLRTAIGINKAEDIKWNLMKHAVKKVVFHAFPPFNLLPTALNVDFTSQRIKDIDKKLKEWNEKAYVVLYSQTMSKKIVGKIKATAGAARCFVIKQELSLLQQKSVALSIYMMVSHSFESMQAGFPFSWVTDSGYSVEDLMSNLLGFYRAVNPGDYIKQCEPVTAEEAFYVWDTYGAVGSIKNMKFQPYLFKTSPNDPTPVGLAPLPVFLNTIPPAREWDLFFELRGG